MIEVSRNLLLNVASLELPGNSGKKVNLIMSLPHYQVHALKKKKKGRTPWQWSTFPALPSFPFLCSNVFQIFRSTQITWRQCCSADSDSVVLGAGGGLRLCISSEANSQMMPLLLIQGPHLSSMALVTLNSKGFYLSYKPLPRRPFSHPMPSYSSLKDV